MVAHLTSSMKQHMIIIMHVIENVGRDVEVFFMFTQINTNEKKVDMNCTL